MLFLVASALSAAGFVFLTALLGARVLRVPLKWSLLAALLAQENIASAAYANTSTFGGCAVLAGIVVLDLWPRRSLAHLLAAVLIALGGWCRVDALALAPLAAVILARHDHWLTAIARTATVAVLSIIVLAVLLAASRVSPRMIWQIFAEKKATQGLLHSFEWLYLLHSATGLSLAAVGIVWATLQKDYLVISAVIAVFVPLFLIDGRSLDTTKYFYYGVPVITWAALWTVAHLANEISSQDKNAQPRWRPFALAVIGTATVLEFCTALQRVNNPARRFDSGFDVVLATIPLSKGSLLWGIGPGTAIPTGDGFRMRGGYGFAPWVWHRQKQRVLKQCAVLQRWMSDHTRATIITSTYFAYQVVIAALRAESFNPGRTEFPDPINPTTTRAAWQHGSRVFTIILVNHTSARYAEFRQLSRSASDTAVLFVNDMGRSYASTLLSADGERWCSLSTDRDGELTLYERHTRRSEPTAPLPRRT